MPVALQLLVKSHEGLDLCTDLAGELVLLFCYAFAMKKFKISLAIRIMNLQENPQFMAPV